MMSVGKYTCLCTVARFCDASVAFIYSIQGGWWVYGVQDFDGWVHESAKTLVMVSKRLWFQLMN